jgi:hypothetical protein
MAAKTQHFTQEGLVGNTPARNPRGIEFAVSIAKKEVADSFGHRPGKHEAEEPCSGKHEAE